MSSNAFDIDALDFSKGAGRVTVVTQDADTHAILMVAQADRLALEQTLATGEMHYTSRTRGLWHKGATSGHVQRVVELTADCDGDAVLARVIPAGSACHTGAASCFRTATADPMAVLCRTIAMRMRTVDALVPATYTQRLLADRNLRMKKLGEETAEFIVACGDGDAEQAANEAADVVYHLLVALHAAGSEWSDVERILAERAARM